MRRIELVLSLILLLITLSGCDSITGKGNGVPLVVITFDDAHSSIYENAFPLLEAYGFPATNVINTGAIGSPNRLDWEQVTTLEFGYGWETAGHTLHHVNLPECDYETTRYEIEQDWQNLIDNGLSHETFALPSGHAEPWQIDIILEHYDNIRTSLDISHTDPIDRTLMGYFAYQSDYVPDLAIQRIMQGIQNKEVMIVLGFHRILPEDDNTINNCTPAELEEILAFISEQGLAVVTLKDAVERLVN